MTTEDKPSLKSLLDYLLERRGVDFSSYHPAMLERRIGKRLAAMACRDYDAYLSCLQRTPGRPSIP